jgi:hypothetical protein
MTEAAWALWIGTRMHSQDLFSEEEKDKSQTVSGSSSLPQQSQEPSSNAFGRQQTPEPIDTIDLTGSPEPASKVSSQESYELRTPPSSLPSLAHSGTRPQTIKPEIAQSNETASLQVPPPTTETPPSPRRIQSYKSLQDFYSLPDKIERTSYVGALFVEAYTKKLRDGMCKDCWLKHNINLDVF